MKKDKIGMRCWIRALEPLTISVGNLQDDMSFMVIGDKGHYYFVTQHSGSTYRILKTDVVFEDRVLKTVPLEFRHLLHGN